MISNWMILKKNLSIISCKMPEKLQISTRSAIQITLLIVHSPGIHQMNWHLHLILHQVSFYCSSNTSSVGSRIYSKYGYIHLYEMYSNVVMFRRVRLLENELSILYLILSFVGDIILVFSSGK